MTDTLTSYNDSNADYSNYPPRMATHSETEQFITCAGCKRVFNTDAKRLTEDGKGCYYTPVTDRIVYVRKHDVYLCLAYPDVCYRNVVFK